MNSPYNNATYLSLRSLTSSNQPTTTVLRLRRQTKRSKQSAEMQGLHHYAMMAADGGVCLELTPSTNSPLAETRIRRLISENPVIIFARSACCMCHVMKRLLSAVGVHPTVIELEEEEEMAALKPRDGGGDREQPALPALYIGGACVGGLESMVALHLSNSLVPKLVEVGALSEGIYKS